MNLKSALYVPALAILLATAGVANASVRVGGSAFFVNGQLAPDHQYSGTCPVDLRFDWGVIATTPAMVTYTITRSDGGHSSSARSIDLPAGRSVPILENWRLGANTPEFASYSGWVELNIDSPNPVRSRIGFTIHCGWGSAATVRVGGSAFSVNGQLARTHEYTGPCPVDLTFDWGVIGTQPTPVTYSFTRSDGGHSAQALATDLPQANRSVPILEHWRLGANTPQFANFKGWVELVIESPNPVANRIGFTLHCQ
jgi:hypothetical protein